MAVNINIHAHLWKMEEAQMEVKIKETLAGMEAIVLLSLPVKCDMLERRGSHYLGNDSVLDFHRRFGDKIIPFAYVDPREQGSIKSIEDLVGQRFKGVKLYPPVGFYPDDERLLPFFRKVEELGIPILCHTGVVLRHASLRSKFARPAYLEGVLRTCPNLRIIAAHCGHPWYWETLALALLNPNLYIDITALGFFLSAEEQIQLIKKAINKIGSERIVYGTDRPFTGIDYFIQERAKLLAGGIEEKDVDMIFGKSAAKLLDIPLPMGEQF